MEHTTFSVDLAKSVFQVAVSHRPGHVAKSLRFRGKERLVTFFGLQAKATIVMEACGSAHHWGRVFEGQGHHVALLPPHAVRPYVTRNKSDEADAKGILEAFRNLAIRPVPVKSVTQQAVASLHRLRSGWLATRTARINAVRGVLREFGLVIPKGANKVVPAVRGLLEDAESGMPDMIRPVVHEACLEIRELEERIASIEGRLEVLAEQLPIVSRLRTVPGVGLLTATALVSVVGDARRFRSGRQFASYLGLTPREHSSGLVRRLGSISKRGDSYVRMLLIHGARTTLWHAKKSATPDRLRAWAISRQAARGQHKASVAVANKLARILWAVWTKETPYGLQPTH